MEDSDKRLVPLVAIPMDNRLEHVNAYYCPRCDKVLIGKKDLFCSRCGQSLSYPEEGK